MALTSELTRITLPLSHSRYYVYARLPSPYKPGTPSSPSPGMTAATGQGPAKLPASEAEDREGASQQIQGEHAGCIGPAPVDTPLILDRLFLCSLTTMRPIRHCMAELSFRYVPFRGGVCSPRICQAAGDIQHRSRNSYRIPWPPSP